MSAWASVAIAVGLGGNLGSVEEIVARFRAAIRLLRAYGAFSVRASNVYESAPAGAVREQPRFINAVTAFRLPRSRAPQDLLLELLRIERALGRVRPSRPAKGPRTIDLDLLRWGELRLESQLLTVPHPRAQQRPFVRLPLADICLGPSVRSDIEACRSVGLAHLLLGHQ